MQQLAKYTGKTGRFFTTRYKEHKQATKTKICQNRPNTYYTANTHVYGPAEKKMKILHTPTKDRHKNTLENFHIYKINKQGIQLNETYTDYTNGIYDTLIKDPSPRLTIQYSRKSHTTTCLCYISTHTHG
jgi:hypothetical protein